jgi:HPt (histidine-containing phosphotransfer) domain-containing protein
MDHAPSYRCSRPGLLLEAVDGDAAIFRDLAQLFIQETFARYDDIVRLSAAGRYTEMGQEAHSLKGTAGTVGADDLVELLQQIEQAGLHLGLPCSAAQLSRLDELLQFAREDIETFLTTIPPG